MTKATCRGMPSLLRCGCCFVNRTCSIQEVKNTLGVDHVDPRDVIFTKVLTARGADANYISQMTGGGAQPVKYLSGIQVLITYGERRKRATQEERGFQRHHEREEQKRKLLHGGLRNSQTAAAEQMRAWTQPGAKGGADCINELMLLRCFEAYYIHPIS
ncbi:hypothetical protein F4820DRAFT_464547 [Hypoxylon rubiginosum]|uniref:Uncharacterized protein n=1 Tax=Hypoxylon rubiginosum TaxID=110542 RepID=A0ACB9YQY4_9PEZI|nr:hypothetical protein F4820DRAFT_464547 [Hypoxylon rubiginosum]